MRTKTDKMKTEHKLITLELMTHETTGLMVAVSPEMKGLYVHARTEKELLERIPVAIRAILEADGFEVLSILEVAGKPADKPSFRPSGERKFEATYSTRAAA